MEPINKLANKNALIGILVAIIALLSFLLFSNTSHAPESTPEIIQNDGATELTEEATPTTGEAVSDPNPTTETTPAPVPSSNPVTSQPTSVVDTPPAVAPTNAVLLAENETGSFVTVSYANLTMPGYIVIQKINSNNTSRIVGHSDLLPAGSVFNVKIQVSTVVAESNVVTATLHRDNGDGKFEFPGADIYLTSPDGLIVSDVDVVGVRPEREDAELTKRAKEYLEAS